MASILVRPPASEPVTLAEAKAHLRVTHGEEDALIGALITSARRVAEAKTGLCFIAQGWTVFRDSWPEDGLITLPLSPVLAIGDLAVHGEEARRLAQREDLGPHLAAGNLGATGNLIHHVEQGVFDNGA